MQLFFRKSGGWNEKGTVDKLPEETRFISDHKLKITGFSKEITMIDYGITNDTNQFVTEIQIPVEPAI